MIYRKCLSNIEGNNIDVFLFLDHQGFENHYLMINNKVITLSLDEVEFFLCLFEDGFSDVDECYFKALKNLRKLKEIEEDESFYGKESCED
jgi:hypothetical protein